MAANRSHAGLETRPVRRRERNGLGSKEPGNRWQVLFFLLPNNLAPCVFDSKPRGQAVNR
jgi:hypothetical protein